MVVPPLNRGIERRSLVGRAEPGFKTMAIRLDQVGLDDATHQIFSDLGYQTLDTAIAAVLGSPHHARMVGIEASELAERFPEVAGSLIKPPRPRFALGANIHSIPPQRFAFAFTPSNPALPSSVNLVSQMPPIRNQQGRGTCVAFATLAVAEHRLIQAGKPLDLSEQFQYWNCKKRDGEPTSEGTYLKFSFPLLGSDGCCLEATWPYYPSNIPDNEGQNPPPDPAEAEAAMFRQSGVAQLPPNSVPALKTALANGQCVAFSIPVYNSWYENDEVIRSGDIVMPFPEEKVIGGHAMCLVGYVDSTDRGNPGGGRFILRNSWGSAWGTENPEGPGYGTIPYAYLKEYGMEAFTLR